MPPDASHQRGGRRRNAGPRQGGAPTNRTTQPLRWPRRGRRVVTYKSAPALRPVGTADNSPAIHRWVRWATQTAVSPVGTDEFAAFNRPYGTVRRELLCSVSQQQTAGLFSNAPTGQKGAAVL